MLQADSRQQFDPKAANNDGGSGNDAPKKMARKGTGFVAAGELPSSDDEEQEAQSGFVIGVFQFCVLNIPQNGEAVGFLLFK